jgi:putative thioredoxin
VPQCTTGRLANLATMDATSPHINDVTTEDFQVSVLQRSRELPVLVDFWAEWCQPCKTLSPLLESLTTDYAGAFELAKVDVDSNQELSTQFGVQSIPTVVAIRDGKEINRFSGALPEESIRAFLDTVLPSELDAMVDDGRTSLLDGNTAGAERIFRQVLDRQSDHPDAGTSLASLLIERGDTDEALIVLGKLVATAEVERLQSAARLRQSAGDDIAALEIAAASDPENEDAQLELAKALAAKAQYEPALDKLLAVVQAKGSEKDAARLAMVDIFGVLGNEHPLTPEYRRKLAAALF